MPKLVTHLTATTTQSGGRGMKQTQVDGNDATRQAAIERLRELETALTAREFLVRVEENHWSLAAKNQAAAADDPNDPLALALGPVSLSQRVVLAPNDVGALCWFWAWTNRDAPIEYEYLAPAAAIAEVTERMSRVLALAGQ
jgi:hypothetical protein